MLVPYFRQLLRALLSGRSFDQDQKPVTLSPAAPEPGPAAFKKDLLQRITRNLWFFRTGNGFRFVHNRFRKSRRRFICFGRRVPQIYVNVRTFGSNTPPLAGGFFIGFFSGGICRGGLFHGAFPQSNQDYSNLRHSICFLSSLRLIPFQRFPLQTGL